MRTGRPKKKKLELKTVVANVRLTIAEKKDMVAAAKRAGLKFAVWARQALVTEAREYLAGRK